MNASPTILIAVILLAIAFAGGIAGYLLRAALEQPKWTRPRAGNGRFVKAAKE